MTPRTQTLLLIASGLGVLYWLSRTQPAQQFEQTAGDLVTQTLSGWKAVQQGPKWVPQINQIEAEYGIPTDLLARMAYQESHFRPDIITGATASPAGALGILQLMPQYFRSVNVTRPYSDADTLAQIEEAAEEVTRLYQRFGDWSLTLAAYNDGQGNVHAWLTDPNAPALPAETQRYVAEVLADVPVAANGLLA